MGKIKKQIEDIINSNKKSSIFSFGFFLLVVSMFYLFAVKIRFFLYKINFFRSRKLPCFVISVGNLTVGGTGKTPMTIKLVELICNLGYKVAVLSRGYKGELEKETGIVSDGLKMFYGPEASGDEPFMMALALKVPVAVGGNRYKAGMKLVNEFSPDIIILDDGFQHLKLKRDLDVLLMDYKNPTGNNYILPRGPLRETVSSISGCDALIYTRSDRGRDSEGEESFSKLEAFSRGKPFFKTIHVPYIYGVVPKGNESCHKGGLTGNDFDSLKGKKALVFSGIARNSDFRHTVQGFGCEIKGFLEFPDHHRYCDRDFDHVSRLSIESGVDYILTTEKDYVRFSGRISWPADLVVIGIRISFGDDTESFTEFIKNRLP